MEKQYALITGATGGLGNAFVYELASKGYSLLLTGRSEEKLYSLQREVEKMFGEIDVRIYPADLSNLESRSELMQTIQRENIAISLLVNVAGVDIQKGVEVYTQEKIAFQCRVNFEAAVSLCHFAIKNRANRLEIINIASVCGLYPMPYFAIYSATKGALVSFSEALREEMKGKNVAVTAVLPGAMPTREDVKEQIKGQGIWGKLAAKSPQFVAIASLKAVRKNKRKVIVGFWNKMMRFSTAWLPSNIRLKFVAHRWKNLSKDAFDV